jgi:hypothetical protein
MSIDEIAERFDLSVPSSLDPAGTYFDETGHTRYTRTHCLFRAVAINDRFATEAWQFEPGGSVGIRVYEEPEVARREYDSLTDTLARRSENPCTMRCERQDARVVPVGGWWDQGEYLEHIEDLGTPDGIGPASYVELVYGVYRGNLLVEAAIRAEPHSGSVDEATAVMHDLVRALLDEMVSHLHLTE